jgi:asparaginyl-tRNA synthetase
MYYFSIRFDIIIGIVKSKIKMRHTKVKDLLNSTTTLHEVNAKGWVRTFRNNQFIALNDGSTINNIQCVVDFENTLMKH